MKTQNNINNKKDISFMNRILIGLFLVLGLLTTGFSAVTYNIEEGVGGVIFDSSNLGEYAVASNTKELLWAENSKNDEWGAYKKIDKLITLTANSYTELTPSATNFTLQFIYLPTDVTGNVIPFQKQNTYKFTLHTGTQTGTFEFRENGNTHSTTINNITWGTFNTLYLTYDQDKYYIYSNNVSQTPTGITGGDLDSNNNDLIFINLDYDGLIDSFKIFDIFSTEEDILNLETGTTSIIDEVIIVNELIKNVTSPMDNENFTDTVKFEFLLNQIGVCNLYIDNNFHTTYSNTLAVSEEVSFIGNAGEHTYFLNCFNENFNELTLEKTFNVSTPDPQIVTFNIIGNDFTVNDLDLHLTSPCMEEGHSAIGLDDYLPYRAKYNTGGITFVPVINGLATITSDVGNNEFCLFHGRVLYSDEDEKVFDYDIVSVNGHLELGALNIPSNVTQVYNIKVDQFEIYDKLDPKAWGETWPSIIGGLILGILGFIVVMAGVKANNGKLAIAGVFLLLSALGISFNGILGLVI